MIVNWCTYHTKPGMREMFCEELKNSGYIDGVRKNSLWYELYVPTDEADQVIVFQGWKDIEQIIHHREQEYMKYFRVLKKHCVERTESEAAQAEGIFSLDTD